VIEEGLTGPELSVFALCDGTAAVPIAAAQDHKRAFDGDEGPNTGGMGAYSPVPFAPDTLVDEVMHRAIIPTLAELRNRDAEYRGVLYCGLMLTPDGVKVIEYNVRFGDPECQVLMPRFASDIFVHCAEAAVGHVETPVRMRDDASVGVVLASEGYPPAPSRRGDVVSGIEAALLVDGVEVFHSGTKRDGDDFVTDGGRVLTVVATAPSIKEARDRAYDAAAKISWPGLHYRRDIASQAL
jgi:phosphoribosylamine--glycine ligase